MANFQSAMSKQDNWNLLVTKHLLMIQVISCNQLVWLNDCTGIVVPSQMTISLSIWHFLASLPKSWLVVTVLVNIITWIRIVICHWQIFIYTQLTSCPFGNQLEDIFLSFEGAAVVNGQWSMAEYSAWVRVIVVRKGSQPKLLPCTREVLIYTRASPGLCKAGVYKMSRLHTSCEN